MDVMDGLSGGAERRGVNVHPLAAAIMVGIASALGLIATWVPLLAGAGLALASDLFLHRWGGHPAAAASRTDWDRRDDVSTLCDAVDAWVRAGCPDGDPVTVGLGLLRPTRAGVTKVVAADPPVPSAGPVMWMCDP
ncbi:MAG: hypothetical protein AAB289_12945 [Chloroflexota bacterium]